MEEQIQFIANCKGWVAIKKLKVTEQTSPKSIMEFLASLGTGIDRKVEEQLGKEFELAGLDNLLNEALMEIKTTEQAIAFIKSRQVSGTINGMVEAKTEMQKKDKKELAEFLKAYATRKVLRELKLMVDYSQIKIPGMKKSKKKKE